jgi:Domain of unknown function (DUF4450)
VKRGSPVRSARFLVETRISRLCFNVIQVFFRALNLLALIAFTLPLPAAERARAAIPPEWIQVLAPNLESNIARPLRYWPDATDFVVTNGAEFFNRPLYCANTAFRVDGGDKPEFSLYVPGRGGNLRFGIRMPGGIKWLNDAQQIVARYRPGSLVYEIHDPLMMDYRELRLTVLPLATNRGIIVRAEMNSAWLATSELIWAFGGANGMRGSRNGDIGCEREPISQFFQLHPDQCRSNEFSVSSNRFTLQSRTVTISGIASAGAEHFIADANDWADAAKLLASTNAAPDLPLVVGRIPLDHNVPVYLVLQPSDETSMALDATNLPKIFSAAENRRLAVAQKVVVETPDPFINAAAAAINVAGDGIWDQAQGFYMHGAVAWRSKYLGWRGPYTGDALGWHERARRHLEYWGGRQNTNAIPKQMPQGDADVNLARNEAALHSNGDMSNSHYDMNLVYIDALFRHLLWTGDEDFARQQWPVIERHLAWERRLFRREFGADKLPLYEAYAAIWASDDLQYHGGGAAHSTAYNYYHNRMAARIAKWIGRDPMPYEYEADLIAKGMRQHLWMSDRGVFAEYKDYLGLQLVHPNAALWTFYHTVDSDVPTPMEAWQMTRFVDTQIAHIPINLPSSPEIKNEEYYTLPTTSWMPYLWSINNVVMAENAHTSLGYWQANRPDAAFTLFKGCLLNSMFMGLCPGNVGMTTSFDMARREAQRDFGDSIGTCSRTMIEGLFGVHPDLLASEVLVRPGFPAEWDRAKIHHPDFDFTFQRSGLTEVYQFNLMFLKQIKVRLQASALRSRIRRVTVNGTPTDWRMLSDSVGTPRIEITGGATSKTEVKIEYEGDDLAVVKAPEVAAVGNEFRAEFGGATVREIADPERAFTRSTFASNELRGVVFSLVGHRTVFAWIEQGDLSWWQPVSFEARPPYEIIPEPTQSETNLRFRVRNNTEEAVDQEVDVRAGTHPMRTRLQVRAFGESPVIEWTGKGPLDLLPGANAVTMMVGQHGMLTLIENWKISAAATQNQKGFEFDSVNLEPLFNDKVTQIFRNAYVSPRSPFCSLAQPKQGIGGWCDPNMTANIDDSGLRRAAADNGGRIVVQGIPFRTPGVPDAKNIVFTSQWDNYPHEISAPLSGKAAQLYLLMAGSSNPMQSQFINGVVIVTYSDGSTDSLPLENPRNWWPIERDYFIDDFAFRRTEPIPPRVDLKTGTVRLLDVNAFKGQGREISGGSATVLDLPLNPDKQLKSLTVRTLANEVVVGLMSATLAR